MYLHAFSGQAYRRMSQRTLKIETEKFSSADETSLAFSFATVQQNICAVFHRYTEKIRRIFSGTKFLLTFLFRYIMDG